MTLATSREDAAAWIEKYHQPGVRWFDIHDGFKFSRKTGEEWHLD
jgi:hypothetical protein